MDLICNHEGTASYVDALRWPGYADAERLPWRLGEISGGVAGDVVGWFRSGGNLSHERPVKTSEDTKKGTAI